MKRKRKLLFLVVSLFLVLSAVSSYAKVVGFYNQQTNRTEYYSDYDKDETFTSRTEAEKYDKQLKKEYDDEDIENEDIDSSSDEEKSGDGFFGFEFPDIGKMIQDWIINSIKDIFVGMTKQKNEPDGLTPNGMFLNNVLHLENHLPIMGNYYTALSVYLKSIALSVVILYVLWYGFKVYILWKDGNPEENPKELLVRLFVATAFILCGEEILTIATSFVSSVINKIMSISSSTSGGSLLDQFERIMTIIGILGIIFEILYFVEYWKMMLNTMKLGIEFFILKLIMPLPCVNIISPNSNTWNAYVSTLIKAYAGICLNVLLLSIGVKIHDTGAGGAFCGLWASAFLSLANKSKEMLGQFIVGSTSHASAGSAMGVAGQVVNVGRHIVQGIATSGTGAATP